LIRNKSDNKRQEEVVDENVEEEQRTGSYSFGSAKLANELDQKVSESRIKFVKI
jgi:hypothetical protein